MNPLPAILFTLDRMRVAALGLSVIVLVKVAFLLAGLN
jgi:hypothetical protein